jgi:hypothetical protein
VKRRGGGDELIWPLDVTPLSIRFGNTRDAEPLTMSGFCRDDVGDTAGASVSSSVEAVTTYWPTAEAPPRSLVARGSVAGLFSGGAAIDPDTGALLGIISSGTLIPVPRGNPETICLSGSLPALHNY